MNAACHIAGPMYLLGLPEWAYQGFKVSWDLPPSGHVIESLWQPTKYCWRFIAALLTGA